MDKQEAIDYLTNFWEHKEGSQLLVDGSARKIEKVEPDYPEQITFEGLDRIHYVQDYQWSPVIEEIYDILKGRGVKVLDDSLMFQKVFKAKPTSIVEAAKTFVELRSSFRNQF